MSARTTGSFGAAMRFPLVLALALLAPGLAAQRDSSLTREFARLSAKERARIAAQEQEEASKDERFQAAMAEAEGLFRQQRFEEALARYRTARAMRPYNVYPKVKIQDLEALLARRAAERAPAEPMEELMPPVPADAAQPPVAEPPAQQAASAPEPLPHPAPQAQPAPPAVRPAAQAKPAPQPAAQEPPKPDGLQERSFVEGRAVVLERRVVKEGVEAVYRKVTHPWGQVVHFRDGIAISEREWEAAFGPQ